MVCENCEKIKYLNDDQMVEACENCDDRSWSAVLLDEINENLKAAKGLLHDIETAGNTEGGDAVYEIETLKNVLDNLAQLYQDYYHREQLQKQLDNPKYYLPLER